MYNDGSELDFRDGFFYDADVKGFDSGFWKGDTADLLADTVRGALKLGDTALPASVSSFTQLLYGDIEFGMLLDSIINDTTNDSELHFGLRNVGDTLNRGAVFFDLAYDTTAGDSSPDTAPFAIVAFDEFGNRQRKHLTWDTDWGGGGRLARFRIKWEQDGYDFYVNDTRVGTLGDRDSNGVATNQVNTQIPQSIRLSKRSTDTTDTNPTAFKYVAVRHARKII